MAYEEVMGVENETIYGAPVAVVLGMAFMEPAKKRTGMSP